MNPHPVPLPLSTNYHPYPYGVAVGELALIGAVSGLYAIWLWFWTFSYDRISAEAHMGHTVTGGYPACCGDLDLILPDGTADQQCSGHCVNQTQGPYSIAKHSLQKSE